MANIRILLNKIGSFKKNSPKDSFDYYADYGFEKIGLR